MALGQIASQTTRSEPAKEVAKRDQTLMFDVFREREEGAEAGSATQPRKVLTQRRRGGKDGETRNLTQRREGGKDARIEVYVDWVLGGFATLR